MLANEISEPVSFSEFGSKTGSYCNVITSHATTIGFEVGYNSVAKLNSPDEKHPQYTKVEARAGLFKSGSGLRLTKCRA